MQTTMTTVDDTERELIARELAQIDSTQVDLPDIDKLRRRMPQANGDQDAW